MNASASASAPPPLTAKSTSETESKSRRLMSVDALRGFDMFWIIGADALVYALKRMKDIPATRFLAEQLDHAEWEGFRFYDLIFPMFVFIMGVSLVFSLTKQIEQGGKADAMKRLGRRFVLMFVVALLYSGGFSNPWPDMRLLGVLNRIALCYLFGGLIFIFFKPKAIVGVAASLLIGYWALMTFMPMRDIQLKNENLSILAKESGDLKMEALFKEDKNFSTIPNSPAWAAAQKMYAETTNTVTGLELSRRAMEARKKALENHEEGDLVLKYPAFPQGHNVANHFDFQFLPGKKWEVYADPEGILSTIPAIVSCLLGVFAGLLLKSGNFCDKWKLIYLFSFGVGGVLLGFLWGMDFPVIKKLWTSSFVLVAGGYSAILLATFYLIVDVWKKQTWCQPFVWMGMNSITIYLTSNVIGGFRKLAARFVGGDVKTFFDAHVAKGAGDLVIAIVGLTLAFLFVRFLYQKKIFLRL